LRLCCKCSLKEKHRASSYCKPCLVEYSHNRYEQNKEKIKARQNAYTEKNREQIRITNAKWKQKNLLLARNLTAKWKKLNPGKVNAKSKERRLAVKNAIPKWVGKDELWLIEEAYNLCQLRSRMLKIQFHVDHIVPILGKNVCGFHSPDNLQVIPAIENWRKGNRLF